MTTRVTVMSQEDMTRSLGWRQGRIYFQGETLAEAVSELNRYNRCQLRIADRDLADFRVGGGVALKDPESFVTTLHRVYGVQVERTTDGEEVITLRGPHSGA